jgi:hypothetical protein
VRIAINGLFGLQNWANVFHAQLATSSSIIQADLDTWTTNFQAAYKTALAPLMTTGVTFSTAKAICYTPGVTELISQVTMTGAGTGGGTAVADNSCCYCLSWSSNVYWRGGKPRTYLPGVATVSTLNQTSITAAAQTALVAGGAALRTAVNALTAGTITGTQFGFLSFQSGNVPRTPPVFYAISGAKAHPRMGSQRRRLGKWQN